jgi:hypothetical protein
VSRFGLRPWSRVRRLTWVNITFDFIYFLKTLPKLFYSLVKILFAYWVLKNYNLYPKLWCGHNSLYPILDMPKKVNKNCLIIYRFAIIFYLMTREPSLRYNNENAIKIHTSPPLQIWTYNVHPNPHINNSQY